MSSKWTFAFSKVLFLTQITRFEKKLLTSSRKKNFWSFSCFFGKFHWYLIWSLQLWILAKIFWLTREKSRDFCQHQSIYIWKVKIFRSISIDLYDMGKLKGFCQNWSIYMERWKNCDKYQSIWNTKSERILITFFLWKFSPEQPFWIWSG